MMTSLPGLENLRPGAIYCIGRNYAEHAKELNHPIPKTPIIFMKPVCSLLPDRGTVIIPNYTHNVHHEAELVIAIGKGGKNIPREDALNYVAGYAIGIDITARDIQNELKDAGKPWLLSKVLDTFSPLGNFVPPSSIPQPHKVRVELIVNGITKQKGNTENMLFPIDVLIEKVSSYFTLAPGDLIYTGTPEGVGPLVHGDLVEASIDGGVSTLMVHVTSS